MNFIDPIEKMGSFDDNFIDGFFDFPLVHCSNVDIEFSPATSMVQEQISPKQYPQQSYSIDIDFSQASSVGDELKFERDSLKKRGRLESCSKPKTKATRERERREKLNQSFLGLSSILEPGRVAKTDKLAILDDAVRVVTQLRTEADEYKEEKKKLLAEIENLKAEKNELREEKLTLKVETEKMELQLKGGIPTPTPGMVPSYPPAAYGNKMDVYPSYGMYPMWHYLPSSTRDTSRDHVLRPPAA